MSAIEEIPDRLEQSPLRKRSNSDPQRQSLDDEEIDDKRTRKASFRASVSMTTRENTTSPPPGAEDQPKETKDKEKKRKKQRKAEEKKSKKEKKREKKEERKSENLERRKKSATDFSMFGRSVEEEDEAIVRFDSSEGSGGERVTSRGTLSSNLSSNSNDSSPSASHDDVRLHRLGSDSDEEGIERPKSPTQDIEATVSARAWKEYEDSSQRNSQTAWHKRSRSAGGAGTVDNVEDNAEVPEESVAKRILSNPHQQQIDHMARKHLFLQRHSHADAGSYEEDEEDEEEDEGKQAHREERKFHRRFKMLDHETLIEDYVCALLVRNALLTQGSMYITKTYVCFYAPLIPKSVSVVIPFKDMTGIKKRRAALVVPNSIQIRTVKKNYFFASFLHRDKAFALLRATWSAKRHAIGNKSLSMQLEDERDEKDDEEDAVPGVEWSPEDETSYEDIQLEESSTNVRKDRSRATTLPDGHHSSSENALNVKTSRRVTETLLAGAEKENVSVVEDKIDAAGDGKGDLLKISLPPISSDPTAHELVNLPARIRPNYTGTFPVNVKEFYSLLLSDASDDFWREYHTKDGLSDFMMEPWSPIADDNCFERKMNFRTPMRVQFGPKVTRVSQTQRCFRRSEDELVFETSSFSRDVPYSSTFLVDSKWVVTKTGENECTLSIFVTVKFVKKTWLKTMIEKNAIDGSRDWFEGWIKRAQQTVKHVKERGFATLSPVTERAKKGDGFMDRVRKQTSNRVAGMIQAGERGSEGLMNMMNQTDGDDGAFVLPEYLQRFVTSSTFLAALLVLGVFVVFMICAAGSMYWRIGTLENHIVRLKTESQQYHDQYLYLRAILAMAVGRSEDKEALEKHWNFYRMGGELEERLARWKEVGTHIRKDIDNTLSELDQTAVPSAVGTPEFAAEVDEIFNGKDPLAVLTSMLEAAPGNLMKGQKRS